MAYAEVDCTNKVCFLEYHFEKLCSLVSNNGTEGCSEPCNTTSCSYEWHKNINCPKWTCKAYETTSLSPISTTTEPQPNPAMKTEIIMISSLVFNVVLLFVVCLIMYLRFKTFRRRHLYQDPDNESHRPIIRTSGSFNQESFSMGNLLLRDEIDEIVQVGASDSAIVNSNVQACTVEINLNEEKEELSKFDKFEAKKNKHRNKIV